MPLTKSAKKALKRSKKQQVINKPLKITVKKTVKEAKKAVAAKASNADEMMKKAYSALDKAAQKNLIHKNNAARKKSRLKALAAKTK